MYKKIIMLEKEITPSFYVEATETSAPEVSSYEFWLGRREYGKKVLIFGVPSDSAATLESSFGMWEDYFDDAEKMRPYCLELLDDDEDIEKGGFEICNR